MYTFERSPFRGDRLHPTTCWYASKSFSFFSQKKIATGTPHVIPFFPSQTRLQRTEKNGWSECILLVLWWGQALFLWCIWEECRSWEFWRIRQVRRTCKRNWHSHACGTKMERRGVHVCNNQSSRNPRSGTHRQHDVNFRSAATGKIAVFDITSGTFHWTVMCCSSHRDIMSHIQRRWTWKVITSHGLTLSQCTDLLQQPINQDEEFHWQIMMWIHTKLLTCDLKFHRTSFSSKRKTQVHSLNLSHTLKFHRTSYRNVTWQGQSQFNTILLCISL